jgi:CTP synthase (UTP-ammonia lyase)
MTTRIALIGDYNEAIVAHRAIGAALANAGRALNIAVEFDWIPTLRITGSEPLLDFDGFWCAPGSPYASMDGALRAIGYARENDKPFLGTCGGFQHALIEYARNVLGWTRADHAETSPDAALSVIAPLACSLIEVSDSIRFVPSSRIAAIYGHAEALEGYHCSYGVNPQLQEALFAESLRIGAHAINGEIRAMELTGHRFFMGTLFQPERGALKGLRVPLAEALVAAASA